MIDAKRFMKYHVSPGIPLTFDEAYQLGQFAIESCRVADIDSLSKEVQEEIQTSQIQSIALLCALHNQAVYSWEWNKESASLHQGELPKDASEQIAGVCAAVFQEDIAKSEFGFLNPNIPCAMDNCGMGGDLVTTANISTIAAFIAAAAGIPMCKHGSPANADQGKYGSSDFISLICGIDNYALKEEIQKCIEDLNFGYTEAIDPRWKLIHLQTHKIAKLPHMNDIIGPITNPLNPKKLTKRVLGVNHLIPLKVVARAYRILNDLGITHLEHGLFVRGFTSNGNQGGMDEVSICAGGTQVAELLPSGEIKERTWKAASFGVEEVPPAMVSPRGNKGQFSLKLLKGECEEPEIRTIIANAAVLFYLTGYSKDLKKCYRVAEEVYQSGRALEIMQKVQAAIPINQKN